MPAIRPLPLDQRWKQRLALTTRTAPELYEDAAAVTDTPHARAIRTTFRELRASAVFCTHGVPAVVILSVETYDRSAVIDLHAKLWNQGLAHLLLVLAGDTLRAFSLARVPRRENDEDFDARCLAWELDAVRQALEVNDLLRGAESGRLWEHPKFRPDERIDRVLLDNLKESHTRLLNGMSAAAAQALLIQSMFIAYLEDRQIVSPEYLRAATGGRADSFLAILKSGSVAALDRLFERLRDDFNGDLFVAPCSFAAADRHPHPESWHLEILSRFRSGEQEMGSGQYRFWGYDFKYMPIELISAVYDRFLGDLGTERRRRGAYYTPRFVADLVISQIADKLPSEKIPELRFLDPACGSGIFLVRCFQLLCEQRRRATERSQRLPWESLLAMLSRLEGWDIDEAAVRVAVFSLYVALLEEVEPPDIRALIERGNLLPGLWERTLRARDFFTVDPGDPGAQADVIVGNPPWSSRRQPGRRSIEWCATEGLPMPGREEAWAFAWKSLRHLRADGVIALLLPSMGFLHNHADSAVRARKRLLRDARIFRIVNLADLRFQLFDSAIRPATLIVFGHADPEGRPYAIEYLTPKADLNLKNRRLITLSSADKHVLTSPVVEDDPSIFKRFMWISDPEEKLFRYLSSLPRLRDVVKPGGTWMIGQGFQPYNSGVPVPSRYVGRIPYLPIERFTPFFQRTDHLSPWDSSTVRRKGFEQGFTGPRVLVPKGAIHTDQSRLRAAYVEEPVTFQDGIRAVVAPRGDEPRAKLLTALVNSRIAVWFAFHGTSSFGAERPQVQQDELLLLPFPRPDDLSEKARDRAAADKMIAVIDEMMRSSDDPFGSIDGAVFAEIDRLAYDFFGLTDEEIILVEDTVAHVIPAVHPSRNSVPEVWRSSTAEDRRRYAQALLGRMSDWFEDDYTVAARLEAHNDDLAILRLTLQREHAATEYHEVESSRVNHVLADLSVQVRRPLAGNFQLLPDFRLFTEDHLYLVKPAQKRFWLRSAAIADADAIALESAGSVDTKEETGCRLRQRVATDGHAFGGGIRE